MIFRPKDGTRSLPHPHQEGGWDVGGGGEADAGELHYDALLAGDAGDTALDAGKLARDDAHGVAALEMALLRVYEQGVVTAYEHEVDEVGHLGVGHGEVEVAPIGVGAEVVVIDGDVG